MTEQDFEIGGASSKQEERGALQFRRSHSGRYADFCRDLAAGFFAAVSLADFLPAIGISISLASWPAFLAPSSPTLPRSASIRSTTFSLLGRACATRRKLKTYSPEESPRYAGQTSRRAVGREHANCHTAGVVRRGV